MILVSIIFFSFKFVVDSAVVKRLIFFNQQSDNFTDFLKSQDWHSATKFDSEKHKEALDSIIDGLNSFNIMPPLTLINGIFKLNLKKRVKDQKYL